MNTGANRAFICRHARERCLEMGVERAEVVRTLLRPVTTYPASDRYGPNRRISVGGRLAVVHTEDWVVITVLWDGQTRRDAGPKWAA